MREIENLILGKSDQPITFSAAEGQRLLARAMARQASRSIWLFTHDLDRAVYDDAEFIDAIGVLARSSPRAEVLVLAQDSGPAVRAGHRLINLAQRLTSNIKLHRTGREHQDLRETFMVVDGLGFLRRKLWERYDGEGCFHAPLDSRNLGDLFQEAWQRSSPDAGVRALGL